MVNEKDGHWVTHYLLVDHSSVFGQKYIRTRFLDETITRIKFWTNIDLYNLNAHPDQMNLSKLIYRELVEKETQRAISQELREEMKKPIAIMPEYNDYDYILGFLIAEPISRAISAMCYDEEEDQEVLLMANDYFGLPSLYMTTLERPNSTKTLLYVNEISPARHLVEQKIPKPSSSRVLKLADKVDILAANGHNSKNELSILNGYGESEK